MERETYGNCGRKGDLVFELWGWLNKNITIKIFVHRFFTQFSYYEHSRVTFCEYTNIIEKRKTLLLFVTT